MANNHASSGDISHIAPRNRDFPQNFKRTARLIFNIKNTHVTPRNGKNKEQKSIEDNFENFRIIDFI